jgi:hypothetical protein
LLTALVVGGVAQLLALYHFTRYLNAQPSGQGWGLAILRAQGLTETALNHRRGFLRWEVVFLLSAGVVLAWDLLLRQT